MRRSLHLLPTGYAAGAVLLLLMTVLAQTFLAFVRSHLVAFSLFSAGHCVCSFWKLVSVFDVWSGVAADFPQHPLYGDMNLTYP